jgi:chlorophyllide a reductase subunit Y
MLNFARQEVEAGPVAAPSSGKSDRPTLAILGEMFPADPMVIGSMLAPMELAAGPVLPAREWREMYAALDCSAVAAIHPFYTATMREFDAAGRPSIGSAPVGYEGTASWLESVGEVFGVSKSKVSKAKNAILPNIKNSLKDHKLKGRITVSGYEGSELIVARLLSESGIDVPYVGTACPRTQMAEQDAEWLESKGAVVKFRASLEDDISAAEAFEPDLAIGTTPLVQHFKQKGKSALYFTNLVSARPLMGQAGAGSFNQLINGVLNNSDKMQSLQNFFEGVGSDDTSGVWENEPNVRPEFRAQNQKKLEKAARAAKAQEMI